MAEIHIESPFDFEKVFREEYPRIARVIARIVRDPARAEDLAAEVFCRLSQTPNAQGAQCPGWLYRTATRIGLDELRRRARREKYEGWFGIPARTRTPEDLHLENEEQRRVRTILAAMKKQQAEILLLRSNGCEYDEIAGALQIKTSSVGTSLRRAEEAFRRLYVRRYGQH